jgi:hypothetical protein
LIPEILNTEAIGRRPFAYQDRVYEVRVARVRPGGRWVEVPLVCERGAPVEEPAPGPQEHDLG